MSNKKRQEKKQQQGGLSNQANQEQVQQQLAQYKEYAHELNKRARQNESSEDILTAITEMDEATQLALVKALGAEGTIEAADVVQALQSYTSLKTVRKEARRALLRLESVDIYPRWQPPAPPSLTSVLEEALEEAGEEPRFWRGEYSDTEDSGEVQLLLFFEQGERYREVRLVGFLLDYWNDGLKDFFTYVKSKRSTEKQIEQIHMEAAPDVKFLQCTLDEARSMIDDALAVNERNNKPPHPDYVRNREMVDELLEADFEESTEEDESEIEKALATLPPQLRDLLAAPDFAELDVSSFLITLENGEYGHVYDNLSNTSPLRQGLSKRDWITRHRQWRREAMPETIVVHFMQQHETAEDEQSPRIDVGWSYTFKDTAESLPEIPTATLTSAETNRHWFLTTFEMVRERGKYRIHNMIDEGQRLLALPEEELRERLTELHEQAEQLRLKQQELEDEELEDEELEDEELEDEEDEEDEDEDEDWEGEDEDEDEDEEEGDYLAEAAQKLTTTLYYRDALIRRTPRDGTLYKDASDWSLVIGDNERAAAYARLWADNVPEQRTEALDTLGNAFMLLATNTGDEDASERSITRAEQAFRECIALESTPRREVLLAHVLIAQEKQRQEAEDLLRRALQEPMETATNTLAHVGLGALLYLREEREQALGFFQKAAELSPSYPDIWYQIGHIQLDLDRVDEAEQSLLRGIQEEPANAETYNALGQLYLDRRQDAAQAQVVLEQGLEQDPENPGLIITQARTYIKMGDLDEAEQLLDEAEELDAPYPLITAARQELAEARRSRSKSHQHRRRKRK